MSRRAGLGRIEAVLLFVLLGGGWLAGAAALARLKAAGAPTRCANTLRQLGLAALQYGDDLRYLPHVGPLDELDGSVNSNATTKIIRALVWHGYHDAPEGFICPRSADLYVPITDDGVKANMRLWFWGGQARGDPDASPIADRRADPILDDTSELSFGWTRRAMSSNVRSTALLGADRARGADLPSDARPGLLGNHDDGVNLMQADATVRWAAAGQPEAERLADIRGEGAGYLAVRPPALVTGAGPVAWAPLLTTFGPPALLALLLVALVVRRPPAPREEPFERGAKA